MENKRRKVIGVVSGSIVVILSLVAWYSFHSEEKGQSLSGPQNKSTLTAEKIKSLKIASNVGNDYFIGSPEEQNLIVDAFLKDNSASDSTYLYFAANTAELLKRPRDAMFLFFAAQIRKGFDYKKFEFGKADGNNIQTYLGYLNQVAGQSINPLATQNPELFSAAIRMIEKWNVVPADNAYYPKEEYGAPKLAKDQWEISAQEMKKSFLNEFAYKQEKLFKDPKGLEASRFVQDYNFGRIPHNSENDKKYQEYLKVLNAMIE